MKYSFHKYNDTMGIFAMNPKAVLPLSIGGLALLLSGCSTGGLHPLSKITAPSALQAQQSFDKVELSNVAWPTMQWWQGLHDTQLDALVEEALADSPTMRIAEARVRHAEAFQAAAGATLLPQVSGSLVDTETRYSANGVTPPPVRGTWQLFNEGRLSVGYDLDFWGKNRAALDGAIGRVRASEVDGHAARLALSSAIVSAYIGLQTAFEQRAIQQEILDTQQHVLDLTGQRSRAELDSQIDVAQAQAQIPAARSEIAALDEQIELSRNRLAALLGKGPDRGRTIARPQMQTGANAVLPSSLPAELLGRRPDVVAQRWRVEAASRDIAVAKASFYPNINLTAFVGLQSLGLDQFAKLSSGTAGIGPAISLPIFAGGRLRANLAAQDAAYDMAVESYNATLVNALHEVADQVTGLAWLDRRLAEQEASVATATHSADLIQKRYEAGLATYLQVLSSQNAVLRQRSGLNVLHMRSLMLRASLSRALGGGFQPDADARALLDRTNSENRHD